MKKLFSIAALIALFAGANLSAMKVTPENTVLVFGLDGVINSKKIVQKASDVMKIASVAGILAKHPTLALNIKEIIAKGKEIFKGNGETPPTNGTANIIYKLMEWLENEKHYKNMTGYTRSLTESFVNPVPKEDTLALIKELKNSGYTIIYATNQDSIQHEVYRRKMLEKGYDLGEIFNGGVYHAAYDLNQDLTELAHNAEQKTWYATQAAKPQPEYYQVVRKLADAYRPKCNIICIDREKEQVDEIPENNFKHINFQSMQELRDELKALGLFNEQIDLD